ncbi:hypothetical protein SMC27_002940 [Cronobacter malonaticus]|nr:hypothetical protein [Cronobacter malonaticus]CCK00307.1 FIG00554794: hypothetical protein [Cronobacter malonaticus 507]ELY3624052.1 hypothetical protein [Cronobacter malonaticus]ELY4126542.1 hypothetical protein [Cronobacter malonaticus]ELY4597736.1 hypothetical protein [Cronobacter malonaticus]
MVIKEIIMSRISRKLHVERVRHPGERNVSHHELRAFHSDDAVTGSPDRQKEDMLRDAFGLWGINAEDGLSFERRLRREW